MSLNIINTLRDKVVRNVLTRVKPFTTAQISRVTGVSTRHTRRVLAELVRNGDLVRENNLYIVL